MELPNAAELAPAFKSPGELARWLKDLLNAVGLSAEQKRTVLEGVGKEIADDLPGGSKVDAKVREILHKEAVGESRVAKLVTETHRRAFGG
jgi:hypothetical protein